MKKLLFSTIAYFVIAIVMLPIQNVNVYSNDNKSTPVKEFLSNIDKNDIKIEGDLNLSSEKSTKWVLPLFYNIPYNCGLIGTATLPITFNKAEFKDGKVKIGPAMTIGYGYTWFYGDFTFIEDGSIKIDQQFQFGLAADIGMKNDIATNEINGSLSLCAFIGLKSFSILGSFDLVTNSFSIGLGTRIDFFTLSSKLFYPYGDVREVYYPRSINARQIPDSEFNK